MIEDQLAEVSLRGEMKEGDTIVFDTFDHAVGGGRVSGAADCAPNRRHRPLGCLPPLRLWPAGGGTGPWAWPYPDLKECGHHHLKGEIGDLFPGSWAPKPLRRGLLRPP
eukprot:EG_transcript_43966